MKFQTINPATEEVISEHETMPKEEVMSVAEQCESAFRQWKEVDISTRAQYFRRLAQILRHNKDKYSRLMTLEMGKPIKQSLTEVEKCAWTAEVYADNGAKWLEDE